MALDSLVATLSCQLTATAAHNITGADYSALQTRVTPAGSMSAGTAIANASAGGADELISKIYTAAASGTVNIDLTSLTDVLLQSSISLARVKGIMFRLLSVAQDATNGTACSSVEIGNAGSNGNTMFLKDISDIITLKNGEWVGWGTSQAAGKMVDGTHKIILVTNIDSGVAMALQVTLIGGTT